MIPMQNDDNPSVQEGRRLAAERLRQYQFPKGTSGNPGGRPRGIVHLAARIKRRLDEDPEQAERIIDALLKDAEAGSTEARRLLFDRHDGPVAVRVEGMSEERMAERLIEVFGWLKERLPAEFHHLITEGAREVFAQDEPPVDGRERGPSGN
jgi:hypothetical protein